MPNFEIFDIDAKCFDLNSLDLISTVTLIDFLNHSTLLEFSQLNKYYRNLCKIRLFKQVYLIPKSRAYEFEAAQTFDIWFGLENDKFQSERDILNNNSKYASTLIISAFNDSFWNSAKHNFQSINNLVLEVRDVEEARYISNLPDNITSLEVFIADKVVCSYEMLQFLNSHNNLKYFKFNSADLLEGLLSPYPSLITLHANIATKSTRLAQAIPNLINLAKIDLTYSYLNNGLINKVKNLPNLKKYHLQSI
ncbi:hypothetical protein CONCODRAFT_6035 [Conidiobolus coronatus NRRL 28638]|uniref:F-box domain-containing protein n=1 Tax=Conidiobolus coronatus (strain ATCC 28846 / CBS 209.66 / NRRL 28638) TaxID=796925 RepID=A0A137P8M8_CONC2|nr:hypothetical protein CONCODRAFT_6035 [Conidiobolus coronatus NRRL 28638]|eukprot:KXN71304.1 hypothetical protein CONCODRAFT_6035 [Conidiobolus coronatus NRRL 28638]